MKASVGPKQKLSLRLIPMLYDVRAQYNRYRRHAPLGDATSPLGNREGGLPSCKRLRAELEI